MSSTRRRPRNLYSLITRWPEMKKKTKQIDELEYKHNLTKYYAPMGTLNELLNKLRETLIPRT